MNNKIGYTLPSVYGRSSKYATDIAKAYGYPAVHVNADDPEGAFKIA